MVELMQRLIKKSSKTRGLPPGALVHIGDKKTENIKISVIDYSVGKFEEREVKNVEECFPFKDKPTVTWINVDGLHEVEVIEKLGKCFEIHPLVLEDILNTDQRPKMEDFEKHIFLILKMLFIDDKTHEIHSEQVSLILVNNFVISFYLYCYFISMIKLLKCFNYFRQCFNRFPIYFQKYIVTLYSTCMSRRIF